MIGNKPMEKAMTLNEAYSALTVLSTLMANASNVIRRFATKATFQLGFANPSFSTSTFSF